MGFPLASTGPMYAGMDAGSGEKAGGGGGGSGGGGGGEGAGVDASSQPRPWLLQHQLRCFSPHCGAPKAGGEQSNVTASELMEHPRPYWAQHHVCLVEVQVVSQLNRPAAQSSVCRVLRGWTCRESALAEESNVGK